MDWRTSSAAGRVLSRSSLNDTIHQALQDTARSSTPVDADYDAHGAAVYVCAVISVYALFVVVFVAILFAVRRRRHPKLPCDGDADGGEGVGRLGGYLPPPPPPPPPPLPPKTTRRRSDSSTSSVSPVRRRSSRPRRHSRSRSVVARSAESRDRRSVDELLVPPRGRTTNYADSRRPVSASPVDDVITLIQASVSYTPKHLHEYSQVRLPENECT